MEGPDGYGRTHSLCGPLAGGGVDWLLLCRSSIFPGRRGTRFLIVTRSVAWRESPTARDGLHRCGNQLPVQVETAILNLKQDRPHWPERGILEKSRCALLASEVKVPAQSTIHAVLDRHGLVKRMRHRRGRAQGTGLSLGQNPNELWCTDYKGEFLLGNQKYCYPLTVTDHASRYLLLCEALESTRETLAITAFERLFQERGLPHSIRSDNGTPFASGNSLFNLSRLSVWWLRLGISIERIRRGHPQQNGRHERMHRTLKKEATRPPGLNGLHQQGKFAVPQRTRPGSLETV